MNKEKKFETALLQIPTPGITSTNKKKKFEIVLGKDTDESTQAITSFCFIGRDEKLCPFLCLLFALAMMEIVQTRHRRCDGWICTYPSSMSRF